MAAAFHNSSDVLTFDNEVTASPSHIEDENQNARAIDKLSSLAPDAIATGEFTNADGINVYTCCWRPRVEIKALLCIVHGYGDHCMRFSGYGEELSRNGILCFSQDLVGFGRSGDIRGPVDNVYTYVRDVMQQVRIMRNKYNDLPLFIYGHSMGAAFSLSVVLEEQSLFSGVIISGNNVKAPLMLGRVPRFFMNCIGKVYPSMKLISRDLSRLTRDKSEIDTIRNDPLLASESINIKFGIEFFRYLDTLNPRLNQITLPIFITHGEMDVSCLPENANYVYDSVSSVDKAIEVLRGCKHNLQVELEPDRSEILSSYVAWILERV